MISHILNTVFTRVLLAILSVLLLILNSNFLGSEGLGTIGLIILEVSIFMLFTNLICGGSMVYFIPRKSTVELLISAYLWIAFLGLIGFALVQFVGDFHHNFILDVLILGIIQSISTTHLGILAGKEKIKWFNSVNLNQAIVQLLALLYFYFWLEIPSVQSFIYSAYIAYSVAALLGLGYAIQFLQGTFKIPSISTLKELISYGVYLQVASVAQLLNYRLSYFILDYFVGKAALGRFIVGVQLSEGLLIPSRSIGTVQFAKIANLNHEKRAAQLTVLLLKITLLISLPLVLVLLAIPAHFYASVLGEDFYSTPLIISGMALGILGLAGESILSRYFSGTGRQKHNAISTLLGLSITLIMGFSLIPTYGFMGAALTSSCSFIGMFIYMLVMLVKLSHLNFSDFRYTKTDFRFFLRIIRLVKKPLW